MMRYPDSASLVAPALLAPVIIATWVIWVAAVAVYRLFFHPLAKFPGPKLAAVTRWYEAYYDVCLNGQYEFKIAELHKEYGPIVRISPAELHINDSSFFNEIYRQDGRWNKYAFSTNAMAIPGAAVFTPDHDMHRRRRGPLNPFLSKPEVVKRHDLVEAKINRLRERISAFASLSPAPESIFNLGNAFSAMTIDISTGYVMGQSYNNLDRDDFNSSMTKMLQAAGMLWRVTKHVPFLGPMMRLMPPAFIEKIGNQSTKSFLTFMKVCQTAKALYSLCVLVIFRATPLRDDALLATAVEAGIAALSSTQLDLPCIFTDFQVSEARTKEIMAIHNAGKRDLSAGPPTAVDAILSASSLPPSEKEYNRVNDEVSTLTGAGFESSAQTLRQTTYHIYANPSTILSRLRAELKSLSPTADWTPTQLMQLPYLTAVLKEGLRLSPGLGTRMARISDQRILYQESKSPQVWTIPPGTPVGMTTLFMHMDADIFPEPKQFHPNRWLDGDENDRRWLEKHYAPFSRGTRMCLGMHLAWAELYLTIAMLVAHFDFEFTGGTGPEDVEWASDQFVIGVKGKNGINVIATRCPS
ncbi:hypothetical protein MMC11_002611 [Xylographa trunciseda]|nr:hypothetical protein [Xylographa trunciseda]